MAAKLIYRAATKDRSLNPPVENVDGSQSTPWPESLTFLTLSRPRRKQRPGVGPGHVAPLGPLSRPPGRPWARPLRVTIKGRREERKNHRALKVVSMSLMIQKSQYGGEVLSLLLLLTSVQVHEQFWVIESSGSGR